MTLLNTLVTCQGRGYSSLRIMSIAYTKACEVKYGDNLTLNDQNVSMFNQLSKR